LILGSTEFRTRIEIGSMGVFCVDCEIVNVQQPNKAAKVSNLLVDSGSELTWIPESAVQQAAIRIIKKDVPFLMADGQNITRSIGYAILRAAGFETIDEVVFGQPGDLSLLGGRTLEGFGAVVDARQKKLVAAGPYPAA
jgi:predicted aspartyl protease